MDGLKLLKHPYISLFNPIARYRTSSLTQQSNALFNFSRSSTFVCLYVCIKSHLDPNELNGFHVNWKKVPNTVVNHIIIRRGI